MVVRHVVVDGSNIATEGRESPSLAQLDDAVRAFLGEYEPELVTVVVDATFPNRIDRSERRAYEDALLAGELVTPPAGAVGRGDAFLLQIADRTGATVLSNDSFQEFHGTYAWLFDDGRLIGGKPVPHVGWVFMGRAPVRGPTSRRAISAAKRAQAATRTTKTAKAAKGAGSAETAKAGDATRPAKGAAGSAEASKAAKGDARAARRAGTAEAAKAGDATRPGKGGAGSAEVPKAARGDARAARRAGTAEAVKAGDATRPAKADKAGKATKAARAAEDGGGAKADQATKGAEAGRAAKAGKEPRRSRAAARQTAKPAPETGGDGASGRRVVRVHELAKELGLTNKECLDLCLDLGIGVRTHSSGIRQAEADQVRARARRDGLVRDRQPDAPTSRRARSGRAAGGAKAAKSAPRDGSDTAASAAASKAEERSIAAARLATQLEATDRKRGRKRVARSPAASEPAPASKPTKGPPPGEAAVSSKAPTPGRSAPSRAAKAARGSEAAMQADGGGGKAEPDVTYNEALPFIEFVGAHPVGSRVDAVVEEFSSHGAYVRVDGVRAYVPLRYLGEPPPRSAKAVLRIGESRQFVVVEIDAARRGVDVALPDVAPPPPAGTKKAAASMASALRRVLRR